MEFISNRGWSYVMSFVSYEDCTLWYFREQHLEVIHDKRLIGRNDDIVHIASKAYFHGHLSQLLFPWGILRWYFYDISIIKVAYFVTPLLYQRKRWNQNQKAVIPIVKILFQCAIQRCDSFTSTRCHCKHALFAILYPCLIGIYLIRTRAILEFGRKMRLVLIWYNMLCCYFF